MCGIAEWVMMTLDVHISQDRTRSLDRGTYIEILYDIIIIIIKLGLKAVITSIEPTSIATIKVG